MKGLLDTAVVEKGKEGNSNWECTEEMVEERKDVKNERDFERVVSETE